MGQFWTAGSVKAIFKEMHCCSSQNMRHNERLFTPNVSFYIPQDSRETRIYWYSQHLMYAAVVMQYFVSDLMRRFSIKPAVGLHVFIFRSFFLRVNIWVSVVSNANIVCCRI